MKSPIKELLVSALLYLPLCFFIWFYAAPILVLPVKYLAETVLVLWQNELFNGINQQGFLLNIETLIFPENQIGAAANQLAVLDVVVNPMKYGYGLAVFVGLVISLPETSVRYRFVQVLIGYLLICLIQANGVFWETCKTLMFDGGPAGLEAINQTGINHDLVAAMYQMSYLIFPAVVPVVAWMILNRQFVEDITAFSSQQNKEEKQS
ncbi:MAG: exosortase H-associated membrane protein [Marinicella sp.]|nr:hypothetical protein [Xanthomonadales bacterium]